MPYPRPATKPPPRSGYTVQCPMFPAVVNIYDDLGHTNQFILVNELAMRELQHASQHDPDGVEEHIRRTSKRHRVRVSVADFSKVTAALPQWYVALVVQCLDRNLRSLVREVKNYKLVGRWIDRDGSEQLGVLEQLASNQRGKARRLDTYPEYWILEHYRLLRYKAVHADGSGTDTTTVALDVLRKRWPEAVMTNYGYANVPSSKGVTFDDFFLCSRIARDFSAVISDAFDLTIEDIVRLASGDTALKKAISRSSREEHRVRNILRHYYIDRHIRRADAAGLGFADRFAEAMMATGLKPFANTPRRRSQGRRVS